MSSAHKFGLVGRDFARKDSGRVLARAPRSLTAPRDELGASLIRLCSEGVGNGREA